MGKMRKIDKNKVKAMRPRTIARSLVRSLELNDGDVILLRKAPDLTNTMQLFNALRRALGATDREKCIVVAVDDFDELRILSASDMLEYGWVKAEEPEVSDEEE